MRAKWYRVGRQYHGLTATTDIEGIRVTDAKAWSGEIIPGDWLRDLSDDRLEIIQNGRQMLEACEPTDDEIMVLYTRFPGAIPADVRLDVVQDGPFQTRNKWWRVGENAYNGLLAVCSVDGICTAGAVALPGDIVPGRWFSGLTFPQFEQLRSGGYIHFARPDPARDGHLYERYPGNDPDYTAPKRKAKKQKAEIEPEIETDNEDED